MITNDIVKLQMYRLGFPLVIEQTLPGLKQAGLICFNVSVDGQSDPVALVEIKSLTGSMATENLIASVLNIRADYLVRHDGTNSLWYNLVLDQSGEYRLVRIPMMPPTRWNGNLICDYPWQWLKNAFDQLAEQLRSVRVVDDVAKASIALIALVLVKHLYEKHDGENLFRVWPDEPWDDFYKRIMDGLKNQACRGEMGLNQALMMELEAILGEDYGVNQNLNELLLRFSQDIQALAISQYRESVVAQLQAISRDTRWRVTNQVTTPGWLSGLTADILQIRLHPHLVLELGAGEGNLLRTLGNLWPDDRVEGLEIDKWLVKQTKCVLEFLDLNNTGVWLCDVVDDVAQWPEKIRDYVSDGKVDLVVSHAPINKGETISGTFELAMGKRKYRLEELVLERAIEVVGPDGLIALILPDTILNGRTTKQTRSFMLRECWLESVIGLPLGSFSEVAGLKSSLVVLRKKGYRSGPRQVFMADLTRVKGEPPVEMIKQLVDGYKAWLESEVK